jgi:K+-sensing histidine kinase KdpD
MTGGPDRIRRMSSHRMVLGTAVGFAGLAASTLGLLAVRANLSLASIVLLFLVPVVAVAATGGIWPALASAVAADMCVYYFFIPPYHTWLVETHDHAVVLVVYVSVAAVVAVSVDVAARHRTTATRREEEAALIARANTHPIADSSVTHLLDQVRRLYQVTTVALHDGERTLGRSGPTPNGPPTFAATTADGLRLAVWGRGPDTDDRRALRRLADAVGRAVQTQHLSTQAARAEELATIDRVRAALLGAVGHDLRTPLAGIKAATSSLRQTDLEWSGDDRAELLATIEESTDRLTAVVENLLSLSRLQAGVLSVDARPTAVDAVVAQALINTDTGDVTVDVDVPDDLPLALADAGLLERVIANLVDNACKASSPRKPVTVRGRAGTAHLLLDVVDHGPGLPVDTDDRLFVPFQRLDDRGTTGLGLGLAIARGFTEAMGGVLRHHETAGGGLTMTIQIPVAS